jgi:hypothetical protein
MAPSPSSGFAVDLWGYDLLEIRLHWETLLLTVPPF